MLTRLTVTGFKNLVDVDVRFSAFTCIAGANGVGKSNLFDAIRFLSALAEKPLIEAALSVRDERGSTTDVRGIFHRMEKSYDDTMSFAAEMIIPETGVDDFGQPAKATMTYLKYALTLAYKKGDSGTQTLGSLEILKEELTNINKEDAAKRLAFPHKASWRNSAVIGRRQVPFISTRDTGAGRTIYLHQDGGSSGRPVPRLAASLPRTVLSASNAAESPTVLLARREMQSWRLLQLEPSSLRQSSPFTAPTTLGLDGSHLASTLYRLARTANDMEIGANQVYARIANQLSLLIEDVRSVSVDLDNRRELLTAQVTGRDGTTHPARALSDGTLRFLALAVLEQDPETKGVICLEEPENGIHPARILAMIDLLQKIAVDVNESLENDNPLRQVIINTHSPLVVQHVPDGSLIYASLREATRDGRHFPRASFSYLPDTWREKAAKDVGERQSLISKGQLLAYLGSTRNTSDEVYVPARERRVIDHPELQQLALDLFGEHQ